MRILLAALVAVSCASPTGTREAPPVPSPSPTVSPATSTVAPTPSPSPTPRPDPVAAADPAGLAAQLAAAERAVRDVGASDADAAWMGHQAQVAYRALAAKRDLHAAVIAGVPEDLRAAVARNLAGTADLRSMTTPRSELPPWRIVASAPADTLMAHYRAAEAEFGVPWPYLAAIHLVETRMGRIRGTSTAGAQGPMQFMPATWAAYGRGDVNDDGDAIRAAARYLRANGAPAAMDNALFRYNNDVRYVRAVTAYAEVMRAEPIAYRGYHGWQVYYLTVSGDVLLPVGYIR